MSFVDTFTAEVPQVIAEDPAFIDWADSLDTSLFYRVEAARSQIESFGIITSVKALGDGLYEKKWRSGLRLYFAVVQMKNQRTLLLLGSVKGREQNRAIHQSKKRLLGYQVVRESIMKKD